ncbi:Diguanylate cyclase DgcM [subsurface metagenome]
MAMYDALTEVHSRRAILKQIETEIARTLRYKRPLSLIMGDIDFFKAVNDRFGHSVGDTVLKQVANALKANTRRSDFVGRFGGEEFLVLLPETPFDKALLLAEKLREKIATISIPIGDQPQTITASFGVCEYEDNMTLEEFIDLSDRRMYQAKQGGRNQVQPKMASSP